jgi:transcriptional regulator with XRE-family HTH domain
MGDFTMAKDKAHFGDRLRMLRQEHEWTLAELAERSGLHLQSLSRLERGERKPTWKTVVTLAKALGCELNEFLADEDRPDT